MSESVVKQTQPHIKYIEKTLSNLTLANAGYYDIQSHFPSGMNNFLFCIMWDYGSVSSKNALGVNAQGNYIYGTGGATITRVTLRYYYTD